MTNYDSIVTPLIKVVSVIVMLVNGIFIGGIEHSIQTNDYQLIFYPNIETAGLAVSGSNLPASAELQYRESGESVWRPGHRLVRIKDGRLIGSLFGLSAATTYEVKVLIATMELSSAVTTQPDELTFTPSTILHVNDDAAAGGDGSAAAPFQTIQAAVNRAGPGTQVLVADGIYRETVIPPASGSINQWIQIKAEGSGGKRRHSGWFPDADRQNLDASPKPRTRLVYADEFTDCLSGTE